MQQIYPFQKAQDTTRIENRHLPKNDKTKNRNFGQKYFKTKGRYQFRERERERERQP